MGIWLSACASLHGVDYKRRTALAVRVGEQTPLFLHPDTASAYTQELVSGSIVYCIGELADPWIVIRYHGTRYFAWGGHFSIVPAAQLGSGIVSAPANATYIGPRGGEYYYNGNGNKQYVTPQSIIDNNVMQTGPRGGQYYINRNGNKTYIKH